MSTCFDKTRTPLQKGVREEDRRPKLNREERAWVLAPTEIKQVFAELDPLHRLIAQLCYYTASRVGEIVRLKREAVIGQSLVIRQPKTGQVKISIGDCRR